MLEGRTPITACDLPNTLLFERQMNNTMARAETGSIQKLDKDRWRIRVSGGADPVTGKRIRLSKTIRGTKKDAIAERTRMQIEVGDVDRATKDMTIAQYFNDVFMPWQKANIRATSYISVISKVNKYIVPGLGNISLTKLSAYSVETWSKTIEAPSARFEAWRTLRQAYNQAFKWGMIQKNIFDKLDPPKKERGDITVADAELATMIIGAMVDEPIEPILLLEISCGLRMSEALALDWEDIDFRSKKVDIHRTYQYVNGEGCRFFETKTKKSKRKVTVPDSVIDRLVEIRCKGGVMRFGPLCYGLKPNTKHERISPKGYRHKYERIYAEKLPGEEFITLKNLRHSHATILLASGVDIKTIADRLGHSKLDTSFKFYLQHVEELDAKASAAFDSAIKVAAPKEARGSNIVEFKQAKEA